jgi:hypothetical protein
MNILDTFIELEKGKIHYFCPICKRKDSNATRVEGIDPKDAVLLIENCWYCQNKTGRTNTKYYDKNGIIIVENY